MEAIPNLPCPMTDAARRSLGFLSHAETVALADRGVTVADPHSVLVSHEAILAPGIVLWPGVTLQCAPGGRLSIGRDTVCFSGTRIVAVEGVVALGADCELGEEGGFTLKAGPGDVIEIGDEARLLGGGSLTLSNRIGRGAQILGPIRCQNCRLGDGGSYREPDPDARGGVLKGAGVARRIEVPKGHAIQAFGLFAEAPMRLQSFFHPKAET